ncbi:MAG: AI-2E family transporter [Nanoarchaeota archaeon]|nr:AI-2E family transporter [Nanoarchaeota archaeon]
MKYAFLTFFLILLVLSFFIIRPFITVILASIIVAYMAYPLHDRMNKKLNKDHISAIIVMMIIILVLGAFFWFIGTEVFKEVEAISKQNKFEEAFSQLNSKCDNSDSMICQSIDYITETLEAPETKKSIISSLSRFSAWIITSIPSFLFNIIIFMFTTFYLLKDGKSMMEYLGKTLPLKKSFKTSLKKQINDLFYSTVYGALIVAIIQGCVGIVAFIVFGSTESPFFWGLIMAISALIPFIGTGMVWLPMALFQILQGYLTESNVIVWKGVGLLLVGALIISTIDNVLKPKIIGQRAGMHPLLIMLGAFGGMAFMGFIGIFIGPIILAFFMSFLKVYHNERSEIFEQC